MGIFGKKHKPGSISNTAQAVAAEMAATQQDYLNAAGAYQQAANHWLIGQQQSTINDFGGEWISTTTWVDSGTTVLPGGITGGTYRWPLTVPPQVLPQPLPQAPQIGSGVASPGYAQITPVPHISNPQKGDMVTFEWDGAQWREVKVTLHGDGKPKRIDKIDFSLEELDEAEKLIKELAHDDSRKAEAVPAI